MQGANQSGQAVEVDRSRGPARPVPPGPLRLDQIRELRQTLARGLAMTGYTDQQIGQALGLSLRTVARMVAKMRRSSRV